MSAERMAAKLRPRVILPRRISSTSTRAAESRGRQLQRLVGRRLARATALMHHASFLELPIQLPEGLFVSVCHLKKEIEYCHSH